MPEVTAMNFNWTSSVLYTVSTCFLLAFPVGSGAKEPEARWVGTWATAPMKSVPTAQSGPAPELVGSTLRQIVHVSVGGKRLRVKFSNVFGSGPLRLASAHVALSAGGSAIRPDTDKALTFKGQPSATIPAGAPFLSDPVELDLPPLGDLAISIKLDTIPDGLTFHSASHATSYLMKGDSVASANLTSPTRMEHWYFLSAVDVEPQRSGEAIVALGDSITDGTKSTTDKNERWPDTLARRLQANKKTTQVSVLNVGIGGNRILHDGAGENALARLDRDVLAQGGVRYLIILEGINDIGGNTRAQSRGEEQVQATDLIGAFEQIVARAHERNVLVYGATILPFRGAAYFSEAGEAERQAVNNWMRTSGKLDGVIDLEAATRDEQDKSRLTKTADSGDHLHPADEGYRMMGNAIDLKLFSH